MNGFSVSDIIKYSSNIGTTKIAFDLTYPLLDETLKQFGFDNKTGVELPAESRGIYQHLEEISQLSLSNLSFGQGIAVTGLQMLQAYAVLANNGHLVRPTIFKKDIKDSEENKERIISLRVAQNLQKMLIGVVEEGTATSSKIPYFTMAGKTGTAQKIDETGEYNSYIATYAGFPVNTQKKFVVFAYVEDPQDHYYGGIVAAPIVRKISEYLLFKNKEYQHIKVKSQDVDGRLIDKIQTTQAASKKFNKNQIPRLLGLDKKSAYKLLRDRGIKVQSYGAGVVSKQSPEAGRPIQNDQIVELEFKPPSYD